MISGNLQPLTQGIALSITAHTHQVVDDPLLIIKLIMDALSDVYYVDDSKVESVEFRQQPIPKARNGYRVTPFVEVACSGMPTVILDGAVRGMRYPLYNEQDLMSLSQAHDKVRADVVAMLAQHSIPPASSNQSVAIDMTIGQIKPQNDIDNYAMYYWETVKKYLCIRNSQVPFFRVARIPNAVPGADFITINVGYQ